MTSLSANRQFHSSIAATAFQEAILQELLRRIYHGISSKYIPQIIVINLGTNDDSYCRDYKDRQDVFSKLYADFLAVVREKNPQAYILCTVGIMGERIFPAVEEGIKIYLKSHADSKISSMMFHEQDGANDGFAANWHPTEKTHTKATAVLTEKLREIIKAYNKSGSR